MSIPCANIRTFRANCSVWIKSIVFSHRTVCFTWAVIVCFSAFECRWTLNHTEFGAVLFCLMVCTVKITFSIWTSHHMKTTGWNFRWYLLAWRFNTIKLIDSTCIVRTNYLTSWASYLCWTLVEIFSTRHTILTSGKCYSVDYTGW